MNYDSLSFIQAPNIADQLKSMHSLLGAPKTYDLVGADGRDEQLSIY